MIANYKKIFSLIDAKGKRKLIIFVLLSSIVAAADLVSIGALMPFVTAIIFPEKLIAVLLPVLGEEIYGSELIKDNFVGLMTAIFIFSNVVAGISKVALLKFQSKIIYNIGSDLNLMLFNSIMHKPYIFFKKNNVGDLISTLNLKSNSLIVNLLMPGLNILNGIFNCIFISIVVLFYSGGSVIFVLSAFIFLYAVIFAYSRNKLRIYGEVANNQMTISANIINDTINSIKDIKINQTEFLYANDFKYSDYFLKNAQSKIVFYSVTPRFVIEFITISTFAIGIYLSVKINLDLIGLLPLLAVLLISTQKLLPIFQGMYLALSQIKSGDHVVARILSLYEEHYKANKIEYNRVITKIRLSSINYRYPGADSNVLSDVNVSFFLGKIYVITGASGQGKSTLLDIVLGLLEPTSGSIECNDVVISKDNLGLLHNSIAYCDQAVYLSNGTIRDNIILGNTASSNYDLAIKISGLKKLFNNIFNDDYVIESNGKNLSSGQRQRIGLARAIYKGSNILILDEALNALDYKSQREILGNLREISKERIIVMVSHDVLVNNFADFTYQVIDKKLLPS